MKASTQSRRPDWPVLAWACAALAAGAAPALAIRLLVDAPSPEMLVLLGGPLLAVSLMGVGIISAAVTGSLWTGVLLAVLVGAVHVALASVLGLSPLPLPLSTGIAITIASVSFAARGALFARSAADKGWLIAVFVVAGEAAILATAAARPETLPAWLLALLPAQWAAMSLEASFAGPVIAMASAPLIALAGTAAATLLVARLWPRRWPYLVMFTSWLGLSALVWLQSGPPAAHAAGL